jgi:hypothetical protein
MKKKSVKLVNNDRNFLYGMFPLPPTPQEQEVVSALLVHSEAYATHG